MCRNGQGSCEKLSEGVGKFCHVVKCGALKMTKNGVMTSLTECSRKPWNVAESGIKCKAKYSLNANISETKIDQVLRLLPEELHL